MKQGEALRPEIKRKIVEIVQKVISDPHVQIILFGSFSVGGATKTSDIDIAIKAKDKIPLAKWQEIENLIEETNIPRRVDVIDYCRVSESFKKIIDATGKILFP